MDEITSQTLAFQPFFYDRSRMLPADVVSMMLDRHASLLARSGRSPINLEYEEIQKWCEQNRISDSELTEAMAIDVARRYSRHEVSYRPADWIMNNLFFALADDPKSGFSELFVDIFNAFDAGEYDRSKDRSSEPSELYTRPSITRILERLDSIQKR
ncbi:hypothetical protein DM806_02035 [Sphingobium lactosutens]|uniref:hypothetical protein n=1 Tax=Sphingobium lactosutens TaxID=522773 RepID=UPI0015BC1EA5|nr:hypothetical protein [Sphingobium lactosutens]NWK94477.1 hypothetical protein [Sphingobium lactosutens]